MDTIRIRNFRSIVDSVDIKINKINILLGRNSSGKSSFVRIFPMLRATVKHELRGPVLWFDDNYDFGSFGNTLCRHRPDGEDFIMFGFEWKYESTKSESIDLSLFKPKGFLANTSKFKVNLYISELKGQTKLSKLEIATDNDNVVIAIADDTRNHLNVYVNGRQLNVGKGYWDYSTKGIIPDLKYKKWKLKNL